MSEYPESKLIEDVESLIEDWPIKHRQFVQSCIHDRSASANAKRLDKLREAWLKMVEYQQVAALVCRDIDVLVEVIGSHPNMEAKELREHIHYLKKMKDEAINDKKIREMRFNAGVFLASIPKGMIRSIELSPAPREPSKEKAGEAKSNTKGNSK